MSIGDNIANLRKEKHLTQEELAKRIHVSAKTISSYETNRSLPNIETLTLLAYHLNTSMDTILGLKDSTVQNLSKDYEKKQIKDTLKKVLLIGLILIVPIFFFWYAEYISLAAFLAQIYAFETDLIEAAKLTSNLYHMFILEYIIYLIIMLINYILLIKKKANSLFILNSLILILLFGSYVMNAYFFIVVLFIDYLLYKKKWKKALIILNILLILILSMISFHYSFPLDELIYVIPTVFGILSSYFISKNNRI